MHDPETLILSFGPFTLWHHDPCRDGTDDSCGWFMRARHGKEKALREIESLIRFEYNCSYQPLFTASGDPCLSTMGITLNLFWRAAYVHFGKNRAKAQRWMRKNLFDILFFAESTVDTLATSIQGRFGEDKEPKEVRCHNFAACVYGYILRSTRPWWKHPRWHFWHWRLHCRPFWKRWFQSTQSATAQKGTQP